VPQPLQLPLGGTVLCITCTTEPRARHAMGGWRVDKNRGGGGVRTKISSSLPPPHSCSAFAFFRSLCPLHSYKIILYTISLLYYIMLACCSVIKIRVHSVHNATGKCHDVYVCATC